MDAVMETRGPAPAEIRARFEAARGQGAVRQRDAARAIGVSEAQAVAAWVGVRAVRLADDYAGIVERAGALGEVMALTRNEAAVHERTGSYRSLSVEGQVGLVLGPDIDLRIFFSHWASAFALTEETPGGFARSLQFFDAHGDAIHKIHLKPQSRIEGWLDLVDSFRAPGQSDVLAVSERPAPEAPRPDGEIDVHGFRAGWEALRDTHDFFGLLRDFAVTRTQGLRLAPFERSRRLGPDAARRLLTAAAGTGLPIMVFVGNAGMIQIHTGPVDHVRPMDSAHARWTNVLDARFNLHLNEFLVAEAWVVSKPTADGAITSVELFDAAGRTIAMFFGARKPGQPENPDWRALVAQVFPEAAPCVR